MAVASLDPASGWICGVVGVHPYQLAYADPRVPEEIWGSDTDTWVASPYAPQGVAKPVDGGYIFNGRWQFSSGPTRAIGFSWGLWSVTRTASL